MDEPAPPSAGRDRAFLGAVAAVQGAAAVLAASLHRDAINPDGLAYVLNARHYVRGELGLAVNGYWGPAISWLIAPLLAAGADPIFAAHLVVAASSVVFTLGAHAVLRALLDDRGAVRTGTIVAAAAALTWSAGTVTPDLLLGGLFALGAARLLDARAGGDRSWFRAGLWLGAAYLVKAVALPAGVLLAALATFAHRRADGPAARPWPADLRRAAMAAAGMLVFALPWIGVLTAHYGRPTFSTTGPIAHAVVGPADVDRWYPTFRTFHAPETGRVTSWEEPTVLHYETWSPAGSAGLFRHQVRVVLNNASAILAYLRDFDLLGAGLALTGLAALLLAAGATGADDDRWRLAPLGTFVVAAPYLPVFCYGDRYFWPALPFLLAASFGVALRVVRDAGPRARVAAIALLAASSGTALLSADIPGFPHSVPARANLLDCFREQRDGRVTAGRAAADALRAAGATGPIHSDCREGLYVAWSADVPWHGQEDRPTLARLDEVKARTVVTKPRSPLDGLLGAAPGWTRVTPEGSALAAFVRR